MRRFTLLFAILSACAHHSNHIAVEGAVLGRVVIYRNGVAFYERVAKIIDGRVAVHVPRDRVDDFLKSLTVVDRITRKPLSVSIPRKEADDGSYLTMTLETPERMNGDVLLTYVTESPAWKPSYRVVVGNNDTVMLEGWAIVDNVSGEDWKGVLVGVGASSALSFRYDLWSVRRIDRDLLDGEERFAVAPPNGVSPYIEGAPSEELVSLAPDEVRNTGVAFSGSTSIEQKYIVDGINTTSTTTTSATTGVRGEIKDSKTGENIIGATVVAVKRGTKETFTAISDEHGAYAIEAPAGAYDLTYYYGDKSIERKGITVATNKLTPVYQKIDGSLAAGEVITVQGSAPMIDQGSTSSGVTITRDYVTGVPGGRTFQESLGAAPGIASTSNSGSTYSAPPPPKPNPIKQGDEKLKAIVDKVIKSKKDVVIETHGTTAAEVQTRGEAVKHKLVDDGVPASRIHVVTKVGANESPNLRVLAIAPTAKPEGATAPPRAHTAMPDTPVGESHFMADKPMNVRAGTSAMVAMHHNVTTGGIVYLYDPISDRGDERFAFKAVRLDNPTLDTLEPGPVTVYGDGRFIGEGITEPVPPKASVVVPFALDRQILVSRSHDQETDRIAKLMTVQRGVLTAEVQHRKEARFTITSRLTQPTKVYLRHRLQSGWQLVEAPEKFMKVGDSQLFEIELPAGKTRYVTISEATPVERTLDLNAGETLDMMKVYIDDPKASVELKKQINALLATHREAADVVDKMQTLRDQLAEYRARAGELNAQIVTLKLVKTNGELMTSLKARLAETSERMHKATLALVDAREKLMLARVKFQNQLADLRLTDVTAKR